MALKTDLSFAFLMDEASGNFVDSGPSGLTFTAANSPGTTTGIFDGCRTFASASSQQGSRTTATALEAGTASFHVCGWAYLTDYTVFRHLMFSGGTADVLFVYVNPSSHKLSYEVVKNGGGSAAATTTADFPLNTWTFFDFGQIWDGTNGQGFCQLNNDSGTRGTSTITGGAAYNSANTIRIGASRSANQFWDGRIDQMVGRRGSNWTSGELTTAMNLAFKYWDAPARSGNHYRRMRAA